MFPSDMGNDKSGPVYQTGPFGHAWVFFPWLVRRVGHRSLATRCWCSYWLLGDNCPHASALPSAAGRHQLAYRGTLSVIIPEPNHTTISRNNNKIEALTAAVVPTRLKRRPAIQTVDAQSTAATIQAVYPKAALRGGGVRYMPMPVMMMKRASNSVGPRTNPTNASSQANFVRRGF